ncbi:MAG: hypothetical protein M1822_007978 [Bathelium mastoideum]|nr:MAG: hypothetical protein M1822_007978 [Bathelium mastoideum]
MAPLDNVASDASFHKKPEAAMTLAAEHHSALSSSPDASHNSNGEKANNVITTDSSEDFELQYVTGVKLVLIVAGVALGCFLMLVDTMVISTAIPRITDQFKSLADVGWYASSYQFGM